MEYKATAPSNIALIKYMGKSSQGGPRNLSLSYILSHLQTTVSLSQITGKEDTWRSSKAQLSLKEQQRFLNHLQRLKKLWEIKHSFSICSESNFPKSAGMASSASSFAALTLAFRNFLSNEKRTTCSNEMWARISAQGSGSSGRSVIHALDQTPWCLWEKSKDPAPLKGKLPTKLLHMVILVNTKEKNVPSSQAHKYVQTSAFYNNRVNNTKQCLEDMLQASSKNEWEKMCYLVWKEFWEMMQLFHTSHPPFTYLVPQSFQALSQIENFCTTTASHNSMQAQKREHPLPIVTMDAGPNIHVLFLQKQKDFAFELKKNCEKNWPVFCSWDQPSFPEK